MENRSFYNEVLTQHNISPDHKHDIEGACCCLEGVNPSCGDDIWIELNIQDGIIKDGAFRGNGCAISQASADIMLDMVIGKTKEEAQKLINTFLRMISKEATEEEIESLEEAAALRDIEHMPSRVKCAVLCWHTLEEILKNA